MISLGKLNAKSVKPHAESQHTHRSEHGNKRLTHAANATIRILLATMTTQSLRVWKRKDTYIWPFVFHVKEKKSHQNYTNALDATVRRTETSSASRGRGAKIMRPGDVWIAIFHHVKFAESNLRVLENRCTSVRHVCIRHTNTGHHDFKVRNIAIPIQT